MGNAQASRKQTPPGRASAGRSRPAVVIGRPFSNEEENEKALAEELAKVQAGDHLQQQQLELLEMDLRLAEQMAALGLDGDGDDGAEEDNQPVASNVIAAAAGDEEADLGELDADELAELEGELEEMERALSGVGGKSSDVSQDAGHGMGGDTSLYLSSTASNRESPAVQTSA